MKRKNCFWSHCIFTIVDVQFMHVSDMEPTNISYDLILQTTHATSTFLCTLIVSKQYNKNHGLKIMSPLGHILLEELHLFQITVPWSGFHPLYRKRTAITSSWHDPSEMMSMVGYGSLKKKLIGDLVHITNMMYNIAIQCT